MRFEPVQRRALLGAAALMVAFGFPLPAQQTVWFTPLPNTPHPVGYFGSTDYLNLFTQTAPWQQAAGHVRVFKIYGVDNFSDTDLTNLLADLKRRNIALALEWPVLTSNTCGGGLEGYGGNILPTVQRISALGGTLAYLAMEQPFQWGSLYTGPGSCHWTAQQVATNAMLQVNQAKAVFPNLLVGDISAVPPFQDTASDWVPQYGTWFDVWRSVSGAPLAFFHADIDWTMPNWQGAVAAIRPVVTQRGIPFGMVYNGFLTNETDADWIGAAENHFLTYEVNTGGLAPDQVNFQSWNPNPTHLLPESDPTAFTNLIDNYFRTRTQVTVSNDGEQIKGVLRSSAGVMGNTQVQITSQPTAGSGATATYTITGTVPNEARTAIVGLRLNSECYLCNGASDLTIYSYQYNDTKISNLWDFTNGLTYWSLVPASAGSVDPGPPPGLNIGAAKGVAVGLNSPGISVTPGAQFTLQVTARVAPVSVGSGYFTLLWFDAAGSEPSRETIMLQPQTNSVATLTTGSDGSYSFSTFVDPNATIVTASYAGSGTYWPALATAPSTTGYGGGPAIVSLTPFAGSGANATLTVAISHPAGWAALSNVQVLINASNSTVSGCNIAYLPGAGTFQLLNDGGTAWSSTALSNSQCSLGAATASGVGSALTLTLPVTFQSSFGSPTAKKNIYVQAVDTQGATAPWQTMGLWYPVTGAPNQGGACGLTVTPTAPTVSGTAGTLSLSLSGGSCGWTATSNASWLTSPTITGTSTLNVIVGANVTGASRTGTLTIGGQTVTVTQTANNNTATAPTLLSLTPFQGTGLSANLTLVYADANGWAAIQSAEFILNPRWEPNQRAGGCYVKYAPGTGLFTLIADDGASVAGTAAPGSNTTISNSQCTLNAINSSATGSGSNLTIVASLTFSANFGGQRHIWMQASDYNNLSTNWLVYGVWFPTQTSLTAGPWYRIYDPNSKSYLYSADQNEYNYLGSQGFVQQGVSGLVMNGAGTVGGISNIAWYRVYVTATNSHFWTSDRNEFLFSINSQQAYVGEGVAAFVMPYLNPLGQISPQVTNTIPFYRAAFQGANLHFWTSDANEYFSINGETMPAGYLGEGIACYIFPASGAKFSDQPGVTELETGPAAADEIWVMNGASLVRSGVVTPGQTLTIYGKHPGGTVLVNGRPAQVIASRDGRIDVLTPNDLGDGAEVSVEVEREGRRTKPVKLSVVGADPAIFTGNVFGRGIAQARNEDGTTNGAGHAAVRGSVVTLFTTGVHGPVEAHIGGVPAEVVSVQVSGTRAGVMEVQVRVPFGVEPGEFQPVVLHVGELFSQPGVGLAVR